jgi:hypothetical protein
VLPALVVVEEGSLLLQEVVEHHLLCLHLCLYQEHCLHNLVHPLLELALVVMALVPVVAVVVLGLELGGPVCFLRLVLLSYFQIL